MPAISVVLIVLAMLAAPAMAQPAPTGMAVSQAPEAGEGLCFGTQADEAIACAQQKCMEETGFGPVDCPVTNWCLPMGWTADFFMQHIEGPHWHTFSCGWQSRELAEDAAYLLCASDWLMECTLVRLWDPQGNQIELD